MITRNLYNLNLSSSSYPSNPVFVTSSPSHRAHIWIALLVSWPIVSLYFVGDLLVKPRLGRAVLSEDAEHTRPLPV